MKTKQWGIALATLAVLSLGGPVAARATEFHCTGNLKGFLSTSISTPGAGGEAVQVLVDAHVDGQANSSLRVIVNGNYGAPAFILTGNGKANLGRDGMPVGIIAVLTSPSGEAFKLAIQIAGSRASLTAYSTHGRVLTAQGVWTTTIIDPHRRLVGLRGQTSGSMVFQGRRIVKISTEINARITDTGKTALDIAVNAGGLSFKMDGSGVALFNSAGNLLKITGALTDSSGVMYNATLEFAGSNVTLNFSGAGKTSQSSGTWVGLYN